MTRRAAVIVMIAAWTLAAVGPTTVASAAGARDSSTVARLIGPGWPRMGSWPAAAGIGR